MKFASRLVALFLALLLPALAAVHLAEPGWGIEADFPAAPKADDFKRQTDLGEEVTKRYFLEQNGLRFMVARFIYPVVPNPRGAEKLYITSIEQMMNSRSGELRIDESFEIGAYTGKRIVISHRREKSVREVRQVLIGSSLYVISAEWPAPKNTSTVPVPAAEAFLKSVVIPPDFADPRRVEENERWREIGRGNFRLRYDASAWYRDPSDEDPTVYNLLRTDKAAEAQLIIESQPLASGTIEEHVLAAAREYAQTVTVKKRGKKLRGEATVDELEFVVKTEDESYVNHGYFYAGASGVIQLRGWATESDYRGSAADINELLDGLQISK